MDRMRGKVGPPSMARVTRWATTRRACLLIVAVSGALWLGCGEDGAVAGPDESGKIDGKTADTACTGDICDPCAGLKAGAACDDGDPCTQGEVCGPGGCQGEDLCECRGAADCAGREDGNLCNGTLYCDKESLPWRCAVNPKTVVACPDAGPCAVATCAPKNGTCVTEPKAKGDVCDDGKACTTTTCDGAGSCELTGSTCECLVQSDCAAFEDGDKCNGTLYCDKSSLPYRCQLNPITVVQCPVPTAQCRTMACAPATGACVEQISPDLTGCDDGDTCTEGDVCQGGSCKAGKLVCPCVSDAQCAAQDDGDLCNGVPYCDLGSGKCANNPATVVVCPSAADTSCALTQCQPSTGACLVLSINEAGACDDGDVCTTGESCGKGICAGGTKTCDCTSDADCAAKEDGNVCNGTLYCDALVHKCVLNPATVVTCPTVDDSDCQHNSCNKATGACVMNKQKDGAGCSDGNACTVGDACTNGTCVPGGTLVCPCATDQDCAKFEDGDLCNGTLYCDKSAKAPRCLINPATVVACKTVDDTACMKTVCAPKTGACMKVLAEGGAPCDDGNPCTAKDGCALGLCQGITLTCDDLDPCTLDGCVPKQGGCVHSAKVCDDGDVCTADVCEKQSGSCSHPPADAPCDDGDACTEADACVKGACKGLALLCDDGNACTEDDCAQANGCAHKPLQAGVCSDGDACTQDSCAAGSCKGVALAAGACDDKVLCTVDICHPLAGCLHLQADGLPCDDGDPCTAPDGCSGGVCKGKLAASLACDDKNPCTSDGCKAGVGCTHVAATGSCDDGDPCTGTGTCKAGVCAAGPDLGCACKSTADCAALEDGDACNGTLVCDKSAAPYVCKLAPATVVVCPPGNGTCAASICNPATGKCASSQAPDGTTCSPPDKACLKGSCQGGSCVSQGPKSCDDGNACTLDLCQDNLGCLHDAAKVQGKPCDDGDACTAAEACDGGTCAAGKVVVCEDGNPCTLDLCDASVGCQAHPGLLDGKPCDDGNACTAGEVCQGKACEGGKAVDCDDGNVCTDDSCAAAKGCAHAPHTKACDDANPCTESDACKSGACNGVQKKCGDSNPCTVDYCDPANAGGCTWDPAPLEGKLCVHPSGCVVGAFCSQGSCGGGDASACGNTGDCKLQGNSVFVTTGPALAGVRARFAPDGSAWAVSMVQVPPTWLAVRYDPFGQVTAMAKTSEGGKATQLLAVHPLDDGGALIGGGTNAISPQSWQQWKSRLRRIDKDGKTVWTDKPGIFGGDVRDIIRQSNGNHVMQTSVDGSGRSTFVVFKDNGTKVTHSIYKGPVSSYSKDHYDMNRLLAEPTGGFYALGRLAHPASNSKIYTLYVVVRFDSAAKRLWVRTIEFAYYGSIHDAVINSKGEIALVGAARTLTGSIYDGWSARVSKSGALLSLAKLPGTILQRVPVGLIPLSDGGYMMTSHSRDKEDATVWVAELGRVSSTFETVWRRSWKPQSGAASLSPGGLAAVPGGGWRMGGSSTATSGGVSAVSSLMIRTDAWGNAPCKAVGKCAGLAASACEDGQACTVDQCEPDKGCVHLPLKGCL